MKVCLTIRMFYLINSNYLYFLINGKKCVMSTKNLFYKYYFQVSSHVSFYPSDIL